MKQTRRRKGWKPPTPTAPIAKTAASMSTFPPDEEWLEGWHMFVAGLPPPNDLRSQGWFAAKESAHNYGPFSAQRKAESSQWLKTNSTEKPT